MSEPTKICTGCDRAKPLSAFPKVKSRCKRCVHTRTLELRRRHEISYGKWRPWSALDDARLLTLGAIGVDAAEASFILERTPEVTRLRIHKLPLEYPGIRPGFTPKWKKNDPKLIVEVGKLLPALGPRKTAARLGVSHNRVAGIAHRYFKKGKPAYPVGGTLAA